MSLSCISFVFCVVSVPIFFVMSVFSIVAIIFVFA